MLLNRKNVLWLHANCHVYHQLIEYSLKTKPHTAYRILMEQIENYYIILFGLNLINFNSFSCQLFKFIFIYCIYTIWLREYSRKFFKFVFISVLFSYLLVFTPYIIRFQFGFLIETMKTVKLLFVFFFNLINPGQTNFWERPFLDSTRKSKKKIKCFQRISLHHSYSFNLHSRAHSIHKACNLNWENMTYP